MKQLAVARFGSRFIPAAWAALALLALPAGLFADPALQANNPAFPAYDAESMTVTLSGVTPGDSYLVVAKEGSAPTTDPTDGSGYAANAAYSDGAVLGDGFVVHSGSGTSISLTKLKPFRTYHFKVYAYNGTDYLLTTPGNGSQQTTKKALTAVGTLVFPPSKGYDGTAVATPTSGSAALQAAKAVGTGDSTDGKPISGDDVSLTGTAAYNYNSKDVATANTVTESGLSLTGNESSYYTLTHPSFSSKTITTKPLTAVGTLVFPASKIYDGTVTATPSSGAAALQAAENTGFGDTSDGKPYTGNGDAVSLTGTAAYNYNSKDVATANTVTESSLSLTGAGSGNYTLTHPSFSATITQKELTMSGLSVPASKVYNGNTAAVVSGGPGSLQGAEAPGGDTGNGKPYTGDTVGLTGTAVGNYDSKDVAAATTVTYSGLSLNGAQAANYLLTIQSPDAATITPKPITITGLTANNRVYNGLDTASISAWGTPGGIVGGDTVTTDSSGGAATFADRHVGNNKTVTAAGLTLGGAQAGNYSLSAQPTTTANITPKALTIKAPGQTALNKVFDGNTTASLSGEAQFEDAETVGQGDVNDGKPYTGNGDSVSAVSSSAGSFNNADVGNVKAVTTATGINGTGSGNYTVTQQSGLTANIVSAVDGGVVNVSVAASAGHDYRLLVSSTINGVYTEVDNELDVPGPTVLMTHSGGGAAPRFYKTTDEGADMPVIRAYIAVSTVASTWHHLGTPINYGSGDALNETLGADLATGAAGGDDIGGGSPGDMLYIFSGGTWYTFYLDASSKWRNSSAGPFAAGVLATYAPPPTATIWLKRQGGAPKTLTFFGPTNAATQLSFPAGQWTMFSWPLPTPKSEGTPTAGWGFAAQGTKGSSWQTADKLMIGAGTNATFLYLGLDSRWLNLDGSPASGEQLKPGEGYYYYHRTGVMNWTPTAN